MPKIFPGGGLGTELQFKNVYFKKDKSVFWF